MLGNSVYLPILYNIITLLVQGYELQKELGQEILYRKVSFVFNNPSERGKVHQKNITFSQPNMGAFGAHPASSVWGQMLGYVYGGNKQTPYT